MNFETTLFGLAFGFVMAGYGFWQGRKPYEAMKLPLIPHGVFLFVGLIIMFLMAAHLITLMTGEPFKGRRRF